MLNLLKNFAVEHFEFTPIKNYTLYSTDTTKTIRLASSDAPKGIFLYWDDFDELWIVQENDEYVIKKVLHYTITDEEQIKEICIALDACNNLDDETSAAVLCRNKEKIVQHYLSDLEYDLVISDENYRCIIDRFKTRVNIQIDKHEDEIKKLRKSYSFLKRLEDYI